MNPSMLDCEILDWFSRRTRAVHMSTVPRKFRARVHMLLGVDTSIQVAEPGRRRFNPLERVWLERVDVVLVQITGVGRMLAAAYRHGRAALAPGQMECVS